MQFLSLKLREKVKTELEELGRWVWGLNKEGEVAEIEGVLCGSLNENSIESD